jgi:hypothetical protein
LDFEARISHAGGSSSFWPCAKAWKRAVLALLSSSEYDMKQDHTGYTR